MSASFGSAFPQREAVASYSNVRREPARVIVEQRPYYNESIVPVSRPVYESTYPRYGELEEYRPRYAEEQVQIVYKEVEVKKEEEGFAHEAWREVVKPVGMGIVAPIAGAGAFIGGCAYGAFSVCKGILGVIPLTIDYIAKPGVSGVGYVVDGVDDGMKYGLGYKQQVLVNEDYYASDGSLRADEVWVDQERRIIDGARDTRGYVSTPIPLAERTPEVAYRPVSRPFAYETVASRPIVIESSRPVPTMGSVRLSQNGGYSTPVPIMGSGRLSQNGGYSKPFAVPTSGIRTIR